MTRRAGSSGHGLEGGGRGEQRVADRGEAVGAALAGADLRREGVTARCVAHLCPVGDDRLLVAIRPFQHEDIDSADAPDGIDHLGVLESAGNAFMLELVFTGIDAF